MFLWSDPRIRDFVLGFSQCTYNRESDAHNEGFVGYPHEIDSALLFCRPLHKWTKWAESGLPQP